MLFLKIPQKLGLVSKIRWDFEKKNKTEKKRKEKKKRNEKEVPDLMVRGPWIWCAYGDDVVTAGWFLCFFLPSFQAHEPAE
jgi:hypothetical protein